MEIEVTKTYRTKMEEGDILVVTVPLATPRSTVQGLRDRLTEAVRDKLKLERVAVFVFAAEPGTVQFDIVGKQTSDAED